VTTQIAPSSHCTGCGVSIAPGIAFCSSCGTRIGAAPVAAGAVSAKKKPSFLAKAFAAIVMIFVALIGLGLLVGPSNSSSGSSAVATADATPALHKIGDTVHVGYWSYQVNGFHWTPVVGDGMMAERADARFIIVDLIIRNDDRTASTMPKIVLVDSEGREFDQSSKGMFLDGAFGVLKQVNPGVESSGHLVFDVPPGQYTIKLSGGIESSERALVALEQDTVPAKPSAAPTEDVQPPEPQNVQLQPAVNSDAANGDATQITPEAAPSDVVPASPTDEAPANPAQQIAPAQPVAQPN
jgi:Domain of unknown function (DUF4352)